MGFLIKHYEGLSSCYFSSEPCLQMYVHWVSQFSEGGGSCFKHGLSASRLKKKMLLMKCWCN